MWKEKLQDTAASHPWLEPHEAIKRKTQAPSDVSGRLPLHAGLCRKRHRSRRSERHLRHMTVFLTEKQYFKAAEQKANGEQINVGLPSTQLKDGKIEVNFYNHESKEAHTIQVNPFAASKANKAAREAFFERKDAEREQGKSLGAKAASARGASEKLDGQTQAAPAKDNLEH